MNACRKVRGPTCLVIPAWRAIRRTIRPAPCQAHPAAIRSEEDGSFGALANDRLPDSRHLNLVEALSFPSGVVVHVYRPQHA